MITGTEILKLQIEERWRKALADDFGAEYMKELKKKLVEEMKDGIVLYPPAKQIFNAFNLTAFDKVKVVILGQDPYHGKGRAHGLSFSVPEGIKPPPSLVNIFKEIESDLSIKIDKTNGNLENWARQGVLLLNAILTVRANFPARHRKHELSSGVAGGPASHRDLGWEKLTDTTIKSLSDKRKNIVFLLWGKFAQKKENLIDKNNHLVLKAPHPSPFSVNSGFFGCKHFSKTNEYLTKTGQSPIVWVKL